MLHFNTPRVNFARVYHYKEYRDMKMNILLKTLILCFLFVFGVANADMDPKKQGATFMETNKTKKGIVSLQSGLQYEVISEGTGKKPGKTDVVTVDYEGKLLSGNVFDSSYKRGQPATFPVDGVIPGWQEALQLMPEGSTWMLYIPPELAYGERGAGGVIGPNETLVFKVHLINVKNG
jgi:FKBP-type peptidyl-prolyl cis-trans isomerase FklB